MRSGYSERRVWAAERTAKATRRRSASRKRLSGSGARGSASCMKSASASLARAMRSTTAADSPERGETLWGERSTPKGSRRRALRSPSSEARQVATRACVSRVLRPWLSMAAWSRVWSSRENAQRACAVVTPILPSSRAAAARSARWRASVRRVSTQASFLPRSLATCFTLIPSSSRSEATTRASSMALAVRRGSLAARRRALASWGETSSTTTGTSARSAHSARRLKPSRTSRRPSMRTARIGSGERSRAASVRFPRSSAKRVPSSSRRTQVTIASGMGPPGAGRGGSGR